MSVQWEGHMRHVSDSYPVSYYSPRRKIALQPCRIIAHQFLFECTSAISASHSYSSVTEVGYQATML